MKPQAVEFLVHMSLATATAATRCKCSARVAFALVRPRQFCKTESGRVLPTLEAGAKEPKIVTMDVDGKKSKTKKHKLNGNRLEWYQRFEYDCRKESKITFKLKDAKGVVGETTMPVSAFNWAQMTQAVELK